MTITESSIQENDDLLYMKYCITRTCKSWPKWHNATSQCDTVVRKALSTLATIVAD